METLRIAAIDPEEVFHGRASNKPVTFTGNSPWLPDGAVHSGEAGLWLSLQRHRFQPADSTPI